MAKDKEKGKGKNKAAAEATEKDTKKATAASDNGKVTVKHLAEEFGTEGRIVRAFIRSLGMKAPEADTPEGTFGPRNKYEWDHDHKDLAKIRKAWAEKEAAAAQEE